MKRIFEHLYVPALIPCMLLFILPIVQMIYPFIDSRELIGVSYDIEPINFSIASVLNTTFQDDINSWVERNVGFRNELIRTDNQINWSIFNEISPNRPVRLIRGKDNFLYEQAYIDQLNGLYPISQNTIDTQLAMLTDFEQVLKKNDIEFLLIVAPSKANTYPEYIPSTWNRESSMSNYTKFINLLKKTNISYIDVTHFFELEKQKGVEQLFPWSGTHWSYYGTCLAIKQFSALLDSIQSITCDPVVTYEYPIGIDQDLASYLNIWIPPTPPMPIKFPTVSTVGNVDHVVFVGDSFLWNITTLLDKTSLYNKRSVFYYNETLYKRLGLDTQLSTTITDMSDEEKKQIILDSDIVIIEVSHTALHDIGFGFVEDMLLLIK